jgi:hypothetical protein
VDSEQLSAISLGAGVQSTTLLLMANRGDLVPWRPVEAIFADTGWEPQGVYDHLAWLESVSEIPIRRVSYGNIRDHALNKPLGVDMPLHVTGARGPGILRRQCTQRYKIYPIRKRIRELMTEHGVKRATSLLGISRDEWQRMKPSGVQYLDNRYPLFERDMTRLDCLNWLDRNGFPVPPKSACVGCPYHDNVRWGEMKRNRPQEFDDACTFDDAMRQSRPGYQAFLHHSRIPLRLVDLRSPGERGQLSLFDAECEGMCGV